MGARFWDNPGIKEMSCFISQTHVAPHAHNKPISFVASKESCASMLTIGSKAVYQAVPGSDTQPVYGERGKETAVVVIRRGRPKDNLLLTSLSPETRNIRAWISGSKCGCGV